MTFLGGNIIAETQQCGTIGCLKDFRITHVKVVYQRTAEARKAKNCGRGREHGGV